MSDSIAFTPGENARDSFPLGRFLPSLPKGAVSAWLRANLPPGSWIIDPFCSAPMVAVEAAQAGYCVLAASNNPIERFLLELYCQPPTPEELSSALADLAAQPKGNERIEPYIRSLYNTLCPQCGTTIEAQAFIWERQSMLPVSRIIDCPACHAQGEFSATPTDQENAARHSTKGLHWYRALERVAPMHDPDRQHAEDAMAAYLPRSVDALFTLVNRLDQFPKERQRLLSALLLPLFDQANNMWSHPATRSRPKQLSQLSRFRELNVWQTLEGTITDWSQFLKPPAGGFVNVPLVKYPNQAPATGGITLYEGKLRDLVVSLQQLPADEPFEEFDLKAVISAIPRPNQAYWSLSTLWAGWLWGSEMTESFKSVLRRRRYDWGWHCTALSAAFGSLSTLMEQDTLFLGMSGESEPGFMTACLVAGAASGFSLEGVAARQEGRQVQILWRKSQQHTDTPVLLPSQLQEMTAKIGNRSLHHHLVEKAEPANYSQLQAVMLMEIVKSPDFQTPEEITAGELVSMLQSTLQHTTLQDPGLVHIGGSERSVESGRWYLNLWEPENQSKPPIALPLADRIEMEVVNYLQAHPGCTRFEVDRALCNQFTGLLTPEAELITTCLNSYGDELQADESTHWQLREQDSPAVRRRDLRELDLLIEQIGEQGGFQVHRTEALGKDQRQAILWQKGSSPPEYLFVLTASAILSPIFSQVESYLNIHPQAQPHKRILVAPGGRSNLIQYKIEHNPLLKNAIDGQWHFLKFRSLRKLAESTQMGSVNLDQLLSQDPVEKTDPQIPLF
ncbi:MAG TPA: hypothetical protein VLM80_02835 [Anaerolineales bacterium]|nr:hypothetical protein [Anaerolineales bacterium]